MSAQFNTNTKGFKLIIYASYQSEVSFLLALTFTLLSFLIKQTETQLSKIQNSKIQKQSLKHLSDNPQ
jgi:hypothetical protein